MSFALSPLAARVPVSANLAAQERIWALQAQGRQILDFTIGEPDLDTPDHIIDAALAAMRRGETHYTASAGIAPLRAAIAEKVSGDTGLAYKPEQIALGAGAKQVIQEAFAATLQAGDEVIIPVPAWVSYADGVVFYQGVPKLVATRADDDFKLTADALAAAITPNTRWLILNAPGNPGGGIYTVAEQQALADVLAQHPQVLVMTDDIYEHLAFDGRRHVNLLKTAPELGPRTLIVNGFSKAYAMTGWRVGYAAGPKPLIDAIVKLVGQSTTCVSSVSQAAALAALASGADYLDGVRCLYEERRNLMHANIAAIPGVQCRKPQGAFYLFPSITGLYGKRTPEGHTLQSDQDVAQYLLQAAGVAVMDGSAYGTPGHLRLSFAAATEAIEAGCAQIAQACAALT